MKIAGSIFQILFVGSIGATCYVSNSIDVQKAKQLQTPPPARAILGLPQVAAKPIPIPDSLADQTPEFLHAGYRSLPAGAEVTTVADADGAELLPKPLPSEPEPSRDTIYLICPPTIMPAGILTEPAENTIVLPSHSG